MRPAPADTGVPAATMGVAVVFLATGAFRVWGNPCVKTDAGLSLSNPWVSTDNEDRRLIEETGSYSLAEEGYGWISSISASEVAFGSSEISLILEG